MTKIELETKWKEKINLLLHKRNIIPEIDVKLFLKENFFEVSLDFDLVLQLSGEKISLSKFVTKMVNYAIKNQLSNKGGYIGVCEPLPGLDYYDNKIDRYSNGESAKYQSAFGKWYGDN